MKRISLRLGIALLTFMIGVGATWSYLRILQERKTALELTPASRASISSALSSSNSESEVVRITLARSYRVESGFVYAEFEVVNVSGEPLYYRGYSKGDNQFWSVRRGKRSTRYAPFCGTGLAERELLPRESARFEVVVGRTGGSLQVGFDFLLGEKRRRETIWSETVEITQS